VGDGVAALDGVDEALARDEVGNLDEAELIGVVGVAVLEVVGLCERADGALDGPPGVEEGVDDLCGRVGQLVRS